MRCQRLRWHSVKPSTPLRVGADHHIRQEMRSLAQPFFRRKQVVFGFDEMHIVIDEDRNDSSEDQRETAILSIAALDCGNFNPTALPVAVELGIENDKLSQSIGEQRIFGS